MLTPAHAVVRGWSSFSEFIDDLMAKTRWKDSAGWVVGRHGFLARPNTCLGVPNDG